jgi:hypothetical protein
LHWDKGSSLGSAELRTPSAPSAPSFADQSPVSDDAGSLHNLSEAEDHEQTRLVGADSAAGEADTTGRFLSAFPPSADLESAETTVLDMKRAVAIHTMVQQFEDVLTGKCSVQLDSAQARIFLGLICQAETSHLKSTGKSSPYVEYAQDFEKRIGDKITKVRLSISCLCCNRPLMLTVRLSRGTNTHRLSMESSVLMPICCCSIMA